MHILGIDPGRQKTGLALIDSDGAVLWRAIVPVSELRVHLEAVLEKWPVSRIALGHSTGSAEAEAVVRAALQARDLNVAVEIINERNSTLQARELYFAAHPRRGWRLLVPQSLQNPPVPIDDFAAAILARRALGS